MMPDGLAPEGHAADDRQRQLDALETLRRWGIDLLRIGWCDLHGMLRGKTLVAEAAQDALRDGIGMVGTLMLKDTSDRTAFPVFDPQAMAGLPGFGGAGNLTLRPDPSSLVRLPWAPNTGWMRAQPEFPDGRRVALDTRHILQQALAKLGGAGYSLRCGLEIEFHIYRLTGQGEVPTGLDPMRADWPGEAPQVTMVHPGYNLLSERWADMADEPLHVVRETARGLGLPLVSLEIELGPSQFEAVFAPTDALTAADHLVLFRNGVIQALRRAGYHATFMCRPPFPNIQSSGWHLHQSLWDAATGRNAFARTLEASPLAGNDARSVLSPVGASYLAGLLTHAGALAALCAPTISGHARFRPHAMAPRAVLWGRDNRGAMLRVIAPADARERAATRIENRLGEPMANPYLCIAAQVLAGMDGIARSLEPPAGSERPYDDDAMMIPADLGSSVVALERDSALRAGLGDDFVNYYARIKRQEIARHAQAAEPAEWERREYFGRY
jgi:glutamine synthetase